MVRKTREEIKKGSQTVTRIACDQCDERYDERGNYDEDGIYTLMLDAKPQRKGNYSYSKWHNQSWGNSRRIRSKEYRIVTDAVIDICVDPCFDRLFIDSDQHDMDSIDQKLNHAIEVEETEYDVVEEESDEYLCDKCGVSMGRDYDHEISLNPRLKIRKENARTLGSWNQGSSEVATYYPDEVISSASRNRIEAVRDGAYHTCRDCTTELFKISVVTPSTSICGLIKDLFI